MGRGERTAVTPDCKRWEGWLDFQRMNLGNRYSMVVGLAVATGYVVVIGLLSPAYGQTSEEETTDAAPVEAESSDAELESRLRDVYTQIDTLQSVEVRVESGVVTLTGKVDEPTALETADNIARQFDGALYVQNKLDVTTEVVERVSPALERAWEKIREFAGYVPLFVVAVVILAIFWLLAKLISRIDISGGRFADRPFVQNVVRQIFSLIVFVIGVVFVLDLFGVTTLVGAVLGTAGVAGLALGFAFRDIAENYLASIILGVQQPFNKNDHIEVGEFRGKVVRMTTRETVLMTLAGNHIRIPNATVFKSPTINYTRNPRRRFGFAVGIGVDEDISDAHQIGIETIRETPGVTEDPEPFAYVDELGDSTVVISLYGWVDQVEFDWAKVKSEAIRRVKNALDAAGIEMPEPIYRVRTKKFEAEEEVEEEKKVRAAQELREPGMEVEASPEIDEQIEEDRAQSEETDLLAE